MSFQDIKIAIRYRSNEHDFPIDFLIPVLSESIEYKRAVGYFSTSALVDLARGLFRMAERGGKAKLVCSPKLSEEDIQAINDGYKKREELIERNLLASLTEPMDTFEEERLNLIATLMPIMRLVLLLDESRGLNVEQRIDSAFRAPETQDDYEKNMELFNSYARDGVEYLYQELVMREPDDEGDHENKKISNMIALLKNPLIEDGILP